MRFIHAADIHLDSPLVNLERYEGAPVEEARGATRLAFRNLVDLAIEEEADFLLIAGDLYDGDWRDFGTGLFFVSRMAELREAGIRVFVVSGNHDAANRITKSLRLPDNVTMFPADGPRTVPLEDLGVALHGQSYARAAVADNLAARYPGRLMGMVNIGILHTALTGREGHEPYAPCKPEELAAKEYDYWALGHVHSREVVSREPWIVFPGNTQGRNAREMGPKGCMLVEVDGDEVVSVEPRELDVMRWVYCEVQVEERDGLDEVLDRVASLLDRLFAEETERLLAVRVVLTGACDAHGRLHDRREAVESEIRALAMDHGSGRAWIERVVLMTSMPPSYPSTGEEEGFAGFLDAISRWEPDEDMLGVLAADLGPLRKRMPTAVGERGEAVDLESTESLRAFFARGKAVLMERMRHGGEGA